MLEAVLGINNAPFKTGLEEAKHFAAETRNELGSLFVSAIGIGGFGEMVSSVIEKADQVGDLSERFRVSSTVLQQFGNVAERNGASLEGVAISLNKLDVSRAKAVHGNQELIASFKNLGVSLDDLQNLSLDQILLKIGHGAMQADDMVQVLGRNGNDLRVTLEKLADGSEHLGDVMSENTVTALKKANDQLKEYKETVQSSLGTTLAGTGGFIKFLAEGHGGGSGGIEADDKNAAARERIQREMIALTDRAEAARAAGQRDRVETLENLREQLQAQLDILDAKEKTGAADAEDIEKNGPATKETYAEKLARVEEESGRKKLALEQQLADVRAESAKLQEKHDATVNIKDREAQETRLLDLKREELRIQQDIATEQDKKSEEQLRYEEKIDKLDQELAKAQFDNLKPNEKAADLLKQLKDLDFRLSHNGTTPEENLQAQIDRQKVLGQLRGFGEQFLKDSQPNFDDIRQHGGGLAGVNYEYRSLTQKQVDLLQQISDYTGEFLNKKLEVKLPRASFGTPGPSSGGGA